MARRKHRCEGCKYSYLCWCGDKCTSYTEKEVTFGCIIVSGYSATYRMETAHSCFSWNDRTIGDVVKKLCEQAKVQLELNPAFKETKDFICQYEESDFDFIRRLAHQYQEWMYFDGTKLIFGKPRKLADPIRLVIWNNTVFT